MGTAAEVAQQTTSSVSPGLSSQRMEAFKGKYERVSAEKYEELLKELDVNILLRKAATVSTPVVEISENGGVWNIKSSTTLKTIELTFKLDEEFDESTPDGRDVTSKVTLEGGNSTKSIRELVGDELVYTITVEDSGVTSVQKF